jgi:hypothetical protein
VSETPQSETVRAIVLLPKGVPADEATAAAAVGIAEESMDRAVAQRPGCRRTSPARYVGPDTAHGHPGITFEADTETENAS